MRGYFPHFIYLIMKSFIAIPVLLLLITACKKDNKQTAPDAWLNGDNPSGIHGSLPTSVGLAPYGLNPNSNNLSPVPLSLTDSIYDVDIPDVTIKSIFSYFTIPGQCTVGLPQDTVVEASFDLDGDLVNDITFRCTNFNSGQSASVPCANYKNTILAGPSNISSVDSVMVSPNLSYAACDPLSANMFIGPGKLFYSHMAPAYLNVQSTQYSIGLNQDKYLGIVLRRNNVTMYGWLLVRLGIDNSITFKAYALNLRNRQAIAAGQTQ
jgi:hypothetical protein